MTISSMDYSSTLATEGSRYMESFGERKRAAGRALHEAFEEVLGVEGPAALARVTQRSKAWWSKLRSGKGGEMPDWREISEEVLQPDLAPDLVAQIRARHREIWLQFHFPDQPQGRTPLLPSPIPSVQLAACREAARKLIEQREYDTAGNTLKLLRSLLASQQEDHLSPEQRLILSQCLTDLSTCECETGRHDAAIAMAQEALRLLNGCAAGDELGLAVCRLASALYRGGYRTEAGEKAELGRQLLARQKLTPRVLELRRANAELLMAVERLDVAEEDLVRQMVESESLPQPARYPVLLSLARIALVKKDTAKARYWLNRAVDFEQQCAQAATKGEGELPVNTRLELERALARLEPGKAA